MRCSGKYSVLSICVVNTVVIILFPRHTESTLYHCKVDLTHILVQWGVSLDSFPPKALLDPIALFSEFGGGKLTTCLYVQFAFQ